MLQKSRVYRRCMINERTTRALVEQPVVRANAHNRGRSAATIRVYRIIQQILGNSRATHVRPTHGGRLSRPGRQSGGISSLDTERRVRSRGQEARNPTNKRFIRAGLAFMFFLVGVLKKSRFSNNALLSSPPSSSPPSSLAPGKGLFSDLN